ncbi:MAG: hypothetical protein AB7I33_09525 [Gemmatimonadales bacterium]
MPIDVRVEPLAGRLPSITWRWDPETDILTGTFRNKQPGSGLTGTFELTDDEGSVAVVDVEGGVVSGLDIVVWPEVTTVPDLAAPAGAREGRVIVPSRPSQPGVASVEVDTTLSVSTNPFESVFHLRIGSRRAVELIQAADNFLIEVDQRRRLAGFWLTNVAPFPGGAALE